MLLLHGIWEGLNILGASKSESCDSCLGLMPKASSESRQWLRAEFTLWVLGLRMGLMSRNSTAKCKVIRHSAILAEALKRNQALAGLAGCGAPGEYENSTRPGEDTHARMEHAYRFFSLTV